jgi:pseudoazurin
MRKLLSAAAMIGVLAATGAASAAEHSVNMLNKGAEGMMVFEPSVLKIAAGDTVKFVAADKGHNAMLIEGMAPEGFPGFEGKMNEDIVVTFDKPGVYGVECKPHYGLGMVMLVVVDEPANMEQAKAVKQKGKAKAKMEKLFEQIEG